MSSPLVSVDSVGIGSWTVDTEPVYWCIEFCYPDGSLSKGLGATIFVDGYNDTIDLTNYAAGGLLVKLTGLDGSNNIILTPTNSTDLTADV